MRQEKGGKKKENAYLLSSPRRLLTLHKAMQPQPLTLRITHTILLLHIIHQEPALDILLAINRNLAPQKLSDFLLLRLRLHLKDRPHLPIRSLLAPYEPALGRTFSERAILMFAHTPVCSPAFSRFYPSRGRLVDDDFCDGCVGWVVGVGLDELVHGEGYGGDADGFAG